MIDRKELVEKMLDASGRKDNWRTYCEADKSMFRAEMDLALSVAIEEIKSEAKQEAVICEKIWRGSGSDFITDVFSRLMLERVKTPAERVVVKDDRGMFWIQLDGKDRDVTFGSRENAEIYRLGLIAKLTAELPKNQ